MKNHLRIFVYVAITIATLALLEYNTRIALYLAVCIFFVLFLLGLFLKESSILRRDILFISGLYYLTFFGYMLLARIHGHHAGDHVELYSPLYTHKIEVCERIDTISLCTSLEANFDEYSGRVEDLYFLKKADTDSTIIYNRFRKVMAIDGEYEIIQRPFHGVMVNLIRDNHGVTYSFDGTFVDSKWKPYLHDVTPVYPSL